RGGQCHRLVSVQHRGEDSVTSWFLCSTEKRTVSPAGFCAERRTVSPSGFCAEGRTVSPAGFCA
ncbi:hypothetical protein NDU88_008343, partial [Pleurodeles waltl]